MTPLPTKAEAKRWAEALRSGKYVQGFGRLEDVHGQLCCLGLACKLFIPYGLSHPRSGVLIGAFPEEQPNAPQWLKTVNNWLANRFGFSFSYLNDELNFTFDEIADIIEIVYVHMAREDFKK